MRAEKTLEKLGLQSLRRRLGLNQTEFWAMVGVTQSGGSRYESGRSMPKPVRLLVELVHSEGVDIGTLKREDMQVLSYLKMHDQGLLKDLKKRVKDQRMVR